MAGLTINGGSQTLDGTYTYDYVTITNGGVLYVTPYNGTGTTGTLILNVTGDVYIDSTSSINGDTRGYRGGAGSGGASAGGYAGEGPCAGSNGISGGGGMAGGGAGGGGYGTAGIAGANANNGAGGAGGGICGTTSGTDIAMGSGGGGGGGGGSGTPGGGGAGEAGGAMLTINANGDINIDGTLNFDGGGGGGGGGGYRTGGAGGYAAGGGIKLIGRIVDVSTGGLYTRNNVGTTTNGGGRIKIFYNNSLNTSGAIISAGTVYYEMTSGSASFTSSPSGTRIWIDGGDTGVNTPNTISYISAGSHNYTLKLAGYTDATGSFSVTGGSTTTVPLVTLTQITGNASFTSNPSVARIWIDGVDKGVNTPNTISGLVPGSHSYTLKLAGYQDVTGSFSVTGGSTTTVPIVTFPASAYFTSTPTGATIWVDDTNLGATTPATVVGLTAGNHIYRLIKIGYTNRGSLSTTAGTTTNVSATLTAVGLNGSIWVEDQYLCYINASNVVTYVVGTSSGAVAGLPGSTWIEGTQLAYIDTSSNKRLLPVTTLGAVAGLDGSLWIDGNYLYYIASGTQRYVTI